MSEDPHHEVARAALERRVLYALMRPAARLARRLDLPLKEVGQWLETCTFHELRQRGLKMRQISEALELSMRKTAQLSKQLKELFYEPELHSLTRRIEFMVWAEPMSKARMKQVMPEVEEADLDAALDELLDQERIKAGEGRVTTYAVTRGASRLVRSDWVARLDGLNQLLTTITGAIEARFFREDERALARNIEFRVRPEDLPELTKLYEEVIWSRLSELDEAARDHADALPIDLAICWSPRHTDDLDET